MKSKTFLMVNLIFPFFFAANECHVIPRSGIDEIVQKTEKQLSPKIDLSKRRYFEGDILLPGEKRNGETERFAAGDPSKIWSNKKIPYVISKGYNQSEVNLISGAINAFNNKTCIQFIPRTTEIDYVEFKKVSGDGCWSYVGQIGGSQEISLESECLYSSIIKHQLMHAVGVIHENSRVDRDDYVKIYYDNIQKGLESQFDIDIPSQSLGTPYDLNSIMHFNWNAWAADESKPTITDKNGNRVEPSDDFTLLDILGLNRLYKCPNGSYINWNETTWNNGRFIWGSDCDFVQGKVIRQIRSNRGDCGGLCSADLNCTHFTWQPNGTCVMKIAPKLSTEVSQMNKEATCGYITQGNSNFQWSNFNNGQEKMSRGCYFPGNDIRNVVPSTGATCFNLCMSERNCTSYAVRSHPGSVNGISCYLNTGKSPIASVYAGDTKAYCSMISAQIPNGV